MGTGQGWLFLVLEVVVAVGTVYLWLLVGGGCWVCGA